VNNTFVTLLASSCLVLTGGSAYAQTARARIANTPIRAEANPTSAIIATLHEGDSVEVVDTQGSWYRVLVPGNQGKPQVGYVLVRLIEIGGADATSARSPSEAAPAAPPGRGNRGAEIPPTMAQLQSQSKKPTEREEALKANVDALRAQFEALQSPSAEPEVTGRRGPTVRRTLATVKKAFVIPVDDLGDDRPVAACFAEHLSKLSPIEAVTTREEADVVLRVKAHLPGQSARHALGSMGGRPSADVFAELPDGTKLWNDGTKLGSGWSNDKGLSIQNNQTTECALADDLIDTLRGAMRKARDKK
jgi:SH3 domain-containing protein